MLYYIHIYIYIYRYYMSLLYVETTWYFRCSTCLYIYLPNYQSTYLFVSLFRYSTSTIIYQLLSSSFFFFIFFLFHFILLFSFHFHFFLLFSFHFHFFYYFHFIGEMFRVTTLPLNDISKIAKTPEGAIKNRIRFYLITFWIIFTFLFAIFLFFYSVRLSLSLSLYPFHFRLSCSLFASSLIHSPSYLLSSLFYLYLLSILFLGGADFSKDFFSKPAYLTVSGR